MMTPATAAKSIISSAKNMADRWHEHFFLKDYRIEGLTDIGRVTARILQFNNVERLLERQALALVRRYPSDSARKRIAP